MAFITLLIVSISILTRTKGCTPCSVSQFGSMDLNKDKGWSLMDTVCIGYTVNEKEIAATLYVSLQINTSYSDTNYNRPLIYELVIYNDDPQSYPSINSSMSCVQKLNQKRTKRVKDVKFESTSDRMEYFTEIAIAETLTREWYIFISHCDETDLNDNNIIYPIIDYNINLTLSQYVINRQPTCNGKPKGEIPTGIIIAIICMVVVLLVIGGVLIWACDVYKRKRIRHEAMQQGLIMDNEQQEERNSNESETNDSVVEENDTMQKDDIQLQTA